MQIREEKEGDVLIVSVDDRLDSFTSDEFENLLLQRIESGQRFFLLDWTKLDYVNSAGLKALLLAAKKLDPVKGQIILCGLATNVQMVFDLTGFHHLFTLKPDRAAALECFRERG
jgi:anti-anti-sigma factor